MSGRGDTDLILHKLAKELASRGIRCCGTVQINSERAESRPCDMDVRVPPDGPALRISHDIGPSAHGCGLAPAAFETAVGLVSASLAHGAGVLIINKFGKHEADGRGFRAVIADALALGIPVIVGVIGLDLASFEMFGEGLANRLPPDCEALAVWVSPAIAPAIDAARRSLRSACGP